MKFKLISKFHPTGDQPQAIEKLTANLQKDLRHQVLLGVTGSGKSVTSDTLVLIKRNGETLLKPIGKIIDKLFGRYAQHVQRISNTDILASEYIEDAQYSAYSINPQTKQVSWEPIRQFTRHVSPENLYRIRTTCGREITVTGNHNVFALRNGELVLLKTTALEKGDFLPIPMSLPQDPNQIVKDIPLLDYLSQLPFYIAVQNPREKKYQKTIYEILGHKKGYGVLHNKERIPIRSFLKLRKLIPSLVHNAKIATKHRNYGFPLRLPLTNRLLRFLGYYIAEGHAEKRYLIISSGDREIIKDFTQSLKLLGIRWLQRNWKYDFQVSSKLLANLLTILCGVNSLTKTLPRFWPSLHNKQLSQLLTAYFSCDGGVEHDEVSCITVSRDLASNLAYALLRFGIIARIRHRYANIPNSHRRRKCWALKISGQKNIARYAKNIGFLISYKKKALRGLLSKKENTNVDIIPTCGNWLYVTRNALALTQLQVASASKIERSYISMIESGTRNPSREVFASILNSLNTLNNTHKQKGSQAIQKKQSLLSVFWSPMNQCKRVRGSKYVYDFSVKNNETFLAGLGGLFVHNTFTMAKVIEKLQKPTLVISPNKTLAAQLYQEFKEFFPNNGVHYFVSYYDYYQPEAYIPQSDTYIEKDAKINEVLDRLRHEAVQDVLSRKDAIVVASVSCIYNIGSPEEYQRVALEIRQGQKITRREFLRHITALQYARNDVDFKPGTFRARGDVIEIFLVTGKEILKIEFTGNSIASIQTTQVLRNLVSRNLETKFLNKNTLYPAKFWVTPQEKLTIALSNIRLELQEQLKQLKKQHKLVEAQRLEQRTLYDLEMIEESGYCHGIENYSRHFEFRSPGDPPFTLLDYFGDDFLIFVDESHLTLPQLRAMSVQDKIRKQSLIKYGFRLPSALDNRPLTFGEFFQKAKKLVYVSATPGEYETDLAMQQKGGGRDSIIEQIVRPTGLLEPEIEIRKTKNQMQDLMQEIKRVTKNHQRALVITLTKRLAEDIAEFLTEHSIKTQWIHSELKTLERPTVLEDLRRGNVDVLVGVNLLREGLDLPEVSLVAILDADKEGFLRNATTLIQTMGRAARHPEGKVILFADKITMSMKAATGEVQRRRNLQASFNKKHGITPQAIIKAIREWPFPQKQKSVGIELSHMTDVALLEREMKEAAASLDFERAAQIRDLIHQLKYGKKTAARRERGVDDDIKTNL